MKVILLLLQCLACSAAQAVVSTSYYHTDRQGSPVVVTAENGNIIWRSRYRPWGSRDQSIQQHLLSQANPLWFSGHVQDAATGLSYMQARYYSPRLRRFLSPDPEQIAADNPATFNRYSYALNNPYRYADPDGREALLIGFKGTGATGAGISAGGGVYVTFPGIQPTPWDIGLFSNASAVVGADISAIASISMLDGGRENIEGLQVTTSATLPLTGALGPAVDIEYVLNPVTEESVGASLGIGLAAFPNASVGVGGSFVAFSLRDLIVGEIHPAQESSQPIYDDAELADIVWFSHMAL